MRLANRVIAITGGASGIGRACALAAAAEGADLALGDINAEGLAETAARIAKAGRRVVTRLVDVTTDDDQEALAELAVTELGGLDGWVGSAGTGSGQLALEHTRDEWRRVMAVNVKGPFLCTRAVLRSMMRERWGRIINISSVVALAGNPGQSNYAAAKSGLTGFTYSVAKELAARNVTANIVAPGYISTDVTENLPEELKQQLTNHIPLGRRGHAWEIAELVGFLCTDRASYITGQLIAVDGGLALTG